MEANELRFRAIAAGAGIPLAIGVGTTIVETSEDTAGAYLMTRSTLAPRSIVPPHVHRVETQSVVVLSGTIGAWVAGEHKILEAGGCFQRPPGLAHSIFNPTDKPASFLEITAPARPFEDYMRRLSAWNDAHTARPEAVAELAATCGITFLQEQLADIRTTYGLTS
ncbi:hypothetical protein GCM10022222_59630 [Amycolatopsis ultiminotia]|uniref:Cupin type-2 domain-containing protein n=1 Tax=Amycolatopsis ultiminotia TaxID=543629 RepID=A0ABP6XIM4_9PSEU